ncbi:aspartyl protease family protein [Altererythrobacter sp.]|uniref:aspartyl protease family protein n=1 Tax=Altererythrobacter sp. TaxID=1872480 RepID=UPI003D04AFF3
MYHLWLTPAVLAMMIGPLSDQAKEQSIAPSMVDERTDVIDLDEDRHNRMTVPVTIEGTGPFDFMIDTGSQATAVTNVVNDRVKLDKLGMATLVGMASRRPVEMVEVESLGIGKRTLYDLAAPLLQSNHVGADGIIGLDSLQDTRVLIDFRTETIAIADVEDRSNSRGYEIIVRARRRQGQLLITNALIEGVRATVIIDTGAQGSMGNLALRDKIRQRRAREVVTTDVNGVSLIGQLTYARTLEIEGMTISNVPITYADTPAFEALGLQDTPVLSIGMQHLRMFDRVAIDFSKRRIMFDLPGKMRMQDKMRRVRSTRFQS